MPEDSLADLVVEPRHLALIRQILAEQVPSVEVRAFGSRVDGSARPGSDLDLALAGSDKLPWATLVELAERFEESSLPFRVDLLDWHRIAPELRARIARRFVVIQG